MTAIAKLCQERQSLLITPSDLVRIINDQKISQNRLEKVMTELSQDGYFELVYSNRKGEEVYCITLTLKGRGFLREQKKFKRNVLFRVGFTVVLAVLSFIIGLILKAIF